MLPNIKLSVPIIVSSAFFGSVWNYSKCDFSSVFFFVFFLVFQCKQIKTINLGVPKNLQPQRFTERRVAFSDRIVRVPIFLAMTVCAL